MGRDEYHQYFPAGYRPKSLEQSLFSHIESMTLDSPVKCDSCMQEMSPHTDYTHVFTNAIVTADGPSAAPPWYRDNSADENWFMVRTACQQCRLDNVDIPCEGYAEMIIASPYDDDGHLYDARILDFSSPTDGIPWNPAALWQRVVGTTPGGQRPVEFTEYNRETGYEMAPIDVVDMLALGGVNAADCIDMDTGELADESVLQAACERYHEFLREFAHDDAYAERREEAQRQIRRTREKQRETVAEWLESQTEDDQ